MKALLYLASFGTIFVFMFFCTALLFALMLGFVSFITWSLPLASPFTWVMFRVLCAISFTIATFWFFSKENKEWVEETFKDLKGDK